MTTMTIAPTAPTTIVGIADPTPVRGRPPGRQLSPTPPQEVVLGHSDKGIALIRMGKAHRCKVIECDALCARETSHCAQCHRSFASDRLALEHFVSNTEHRDPTDRQAKILFNRFGTGVWSTARVLP